jgi:DNA-binding NarL/FixJ family response regulator
VKTLRIALIEDDRATREGLVTLLNGEPDTRCTCAFSSVEQALSSPPRDDIDVLLLDINLPGISGAEGIGQLREHWPAAQVLMLTVFPDADKVFQSICNGAVGYLLKKTPARQLLSAIRDAASGGAPMSPEVARKVVDLVRQHRLKPLQPESDLSRQELRLLQLLADGFGYDSAGRQMGISVNTVRTYVRSIYEKLHVTTKAAAVSRALRAGLIQ